MINISIDTKYINSILKRAADKIESITGIKQLRIVGSELKCLYPVELPLGGTMDIVVAITPEASDDAKSILLYLRVPAGPLSQPAAAKAAVELAKRISLPDVSAHGGTVIIPIDKFFGGISLLLTEEHLSIKIRV